MHLIFYFAALLLFYIFIGYPLFLASLALFMSKKVEKMDYCPSVSLIISAYNEEGCIAEKMHNSLNLDYPKEKLEIIVASESNDRTNDIVKSFADKGVVLYSYDGREGKRATLFKTVPRARGEIIIFSDANASYQKDAISKIVRNFYDKRIGCVSGRLVYRNPKGSSIGKGENAYWELDFFLKSIASRMMLLGAFGGVNGSIFAVRKELYDPIDKYRGDDFEISCRVQINGRGVVVEPEAVSYEDISERSSQEFKRKVRLATWNLRSTVILLREAVLKRKFLIALLLASHRLLRYTTPIWLVTLFFSNIFLIGIVYLRIFFLAQLIFYVLAFLGYSFEKRSHKINPALVLPFYFCMVNCAAGLAIVRNFSQDSPHLWEKTR